MRSCYYTPHARFSEVFTESFFGRHRAQSVVLVSFSCTPDASFSFLFSPNVGSFSYTPDAIFSEEFVLHS